MNNTETEQQQYLDFVNSISENKRSLVELQNLPLRERLRLNGLFEDYIFEKEVRNSSKVDAKVLRRLNYLKRLISKYKHLWSKSDRLFLWVDEYNNLRADNHEVFNRYCKIYGYCPTHNGHDTLA
jgi:hypothetical protein